MARSNSNNMKHSAWIPLVLYGLSATYALAVAEMPTTPAARREDSLFETLSSDRLSGDWHQAGKRQTQTVELTPELLAELLSQLEASQLEAVYGQLSAYSATRNTGLLNNLLHFVGGVVPPLSDVIESVREILVGDSDTVLEQLALAAAIGQET